VRYRYLVISARDSLYLRLVKGERPVVVRLSRPVVAGDFRFLVRIETTMPHLSHTQLSPPGSCFRGSVWHSGHNVSVVAIAGTFCRGILPPRNQGCQPEIFVGIELIERREKPVPSCPKPFLPSVASPVRIQRQYRQIGCDSSIMRYRCHANDVVALQARIAHRVLGFSADTYGQSAD